MQITRTALEGPLIIEPDVYRDARGLFTEVYHAERFSAAGLPGRFVQDNHSQSVRGTLRGLHWQWRRPQAKLVRTILGQIFDVAVDIRRGSPTFGAWLGIHLSADSYRQIYIPEGFAHGFCVVSDVAVVEYKCTDFYDPEGEAGLRWDDPSVAIAWPVESPVLSAKDAALPPLASVRLDIPSVDDSGTLAWPSSGAV
jgi:dTDP-4-dehydrorhamnose 3,5-epimerase